MSSIPIFLSSDNNYAPFVATTIASICDNTNSFCEFYILDGGITEENKEKICELKKIFNNFSIEFINVDVEKEFKGFRYNTYITKSMYSRFLIPILKPEIKKALYSDVDVIVLGDIKEMFDEPLDGYVLGAVHDYKSRDITFKKHRNEVKLDKKHPYFDSGNLLIDCEGWKKEKIFDKLMVLARTRSFEFSLPDQDILNVCFENNYKILDDKYCYCVANGVNNPNGEVVIRHFNSQIKPWHINPNTKTDMMPHLKEFWDYARKTAFYDELYQKTLDEKEQQNVLRALRVVIITNRMRDKKEK